MAAGANAAYADKALLMPQPIEQVFAPLTSELPAVDLYELLQDLEQQFGQHPSLNLLIEMDYGFTSESDFDEDELPPMLKGRQYWHLTPSGLRGYYTVVISAIYLIELCAVPGATVGDVITELFGLDEEDTPALSGVGLGVNARNR